VIIAQFFSCIDHSENKLHFDEMIMMRMSAL